MHTNPLFASHDLIDYAAVTPACVTPAIEELLSQAQAALDEVTQADTPVTWQAFEPLDEAVYRLSRAWGVATHLQSVIDNAEWREAVNHNLPAISLFFLQMGQHQGLYEKYQALRQSDEFAKLNADRQRILEHTLRDFRLIGAHLPEDVRAQVTAISQELTQLSQQFSEHVLDATNAWTLHLTDDTRLKGISPTDLALFKAAAVARDLPGYLITLQMPSVLAILTYCEDRELRHDVHRAYHTRASELGDPKLDNTALIDRILELRQQAAHLLGFETFAHESLATKMADTPQEVLDFLMDLAQRARPYALKDKDELIAFAATLGLDTLQPWDTAFVSEKLRQARYQFSESEVREYFTQSAVFEGLFHVANSLYGITVEKATASVWHPSVEYFVVKKGDTPIAGFYADLYAREGKRGGAWMNDDRPRQATAHGIDLPTAYLICNFAAPQPGHEATLLLDEVTTLFHEFGHTLHHLLTQQTERSLSGIAGVEWDAVELPSQFMENFVWDRRVMKMLTRHQTSGQSMPDELFDKLVAAKNFQSGLMCMRQLEFALFDMKLHMLDKPDVQAVLQEVRTLTQMLPVAEYARFACTFGHIFAGGYAAGYYSYKWAEVLSSDAFAAFEETDILSRQTGERFEAEVLARGSSRDAMDNFVAFRGRKPTIDALLRHSGMSA